jgi:myo-inositol-1(or 4)-monophosphatase
MPQSSSFADLQNFLEIATEAALAAGAIINSHRGNLEGQIQTKSRPDDLVTIADRESETQIVEILQRHLPSHSILAEETGKYGNSNAEFLWVIDPLDGTTNYSHQYPFSAVSIGLLVAGVPTLGVIFDPWHQELFRAATGLGATVTVDRSAFRVLLLWPRACWSRALPTIDEKPPTTTIGSFAI